MIYKKCAFHIMKCTFFLFFIWGRAQEITHPKQAPAPLARRVFWQLRLRRLDILQPAAHHMPPPPKKTKTEHKQLRLCFIEPALIKEALIKVLDVIPFQARIPELPQGYSHCHALIQRTRRIFQARENHPM